jgi:hypothetical protein
MATIIAGPHRNSFSLASISKNQFNARTSLSRRLTHAPHTKSLCFEQSSVTSPRGGPSKESRILDIVMAGMATKGKEKLRKSIRA